MFDLTRLAYVAKARREAMELTMRQLEAVTGVSRTQISHCEHGKAISAGNTFMLMEALGIDPADMLNEAAAVRLERIRRVHRQADPDGVLKREMASRETGGVTSPDLTQEASPPLRSGRAGRSSLADAACASAGGVPGSLRGRASEHSECQPVNGRRAGRPGERTST